MLLAPPPRMRTNFIWLAGTAEQCLRQVEQEEVKEMHHGVALH